MFLPKTIEGIKRFTERKILSKAFCFDCLKDLAGAAAFGSDRPKNRGFSSGSVLIKQLYYDF